MCIQIKFDKRSRQTVSHRKSHDLIHESFESEIMIVKLNDNDVSIEMHADKKMVERFIYMQER